MKAMLMVDDEPSICALVSEVLSEFGVRVIIANDGVEAVRILEQEPTNIALVVLDYSMPGMDCETLVREIRRINEEIKLIISSGEPRVICDNPEDHGIVAMLPKPYSMREMAELVLTHLGT